jgi:hypothetical protein
MSGDQMLTIEEAMKELQIKRDELKELLRQNSLRYILDEGTIKIPKMAIMALKLERMTSSTQQFAQVKRTRRKKETSLIDMSSQKMLTLDETMSKLQVDRSKLDALIAAKKLRTVMVGDECKIPLMSVQALQIQNTLDVPLSQPRKLEKKKSLVRRVY